jgi:hypothetical protein
MMTISLPGVLKRAAKAVKNSGNGHLEFPLLQLLDHLREFRQRGPDAFEEFFTLWRDGEQKEGDK